MKIWDKIVQSDTEPSTSSIWLKEGKLWYYNNGKWTPVNATDPNLDTTVFSVVEKLPDDPSDNKIYITPSTKPGEDNKFVEWCYINGEWEKFGEFEAEVDLTDVLKKSDIGTEVCGMYSDPKVFDGYAAKGPFLISGTTEYHTPEEFRELEPWESTINGGIQENLIHLQFPALHKSVSLLETMNTSRADGTIVTLGLYKNIFQELFDTRTVGSNTYPVLKTLYQSPFNISLVTGVTGYGTPLYSVLNSDNSYRYNLYVYDGTRNLTSTSVNLVTEKGLYAELSKMKDISTGTLKAPVLPPLNVTIYNNARFSPFVINTDDEKVNFGVSIYDGSRGMVSNAGNFVEEKALYKVLNEFVSIKDNYQLRPSSMPGIGFTRSGDASPANPFYLNPDDTNELSLWFGYNAWDGTREAVSNSSNLVEEKAIYGLLDEFTTEVSGVRRIKSSRSTQIATAAVNAASVDSPISVVRTSDSLLKFNYNVFSGREFRELDNNSNSFVTEKGLAEIYHTIINTETGKLQKYVISAPSTHYVGTGVTENVNGVALSASTTTGSPVLTYRYYDGSREISENNNNVVTEKGLYKELQLIKTAYTKAPLQIITSGGATDGTNGYIDYDWLSRSANTFGGIPVLTKDSDETPIIRTSQIPITAGHGVTITKDEESIEVSVDYDNSNVAYIAHLDIGDSDAVKTVNQSQIPLNSDPFLVCIDYGVGTGRFIAGTGGSITITTAEGTRVHYKINSDYSIVKDESHFDHSELFYNLGIINLSEISATENKTITISDPIEVLYFKKASNLAFTVHTDSGDFEVNCPQVSVGPTQKIFNSPDIIAGNEDEWNYLKTTATIGASEISITIEAM